jgi:hypothetical protein
MADYKRGNSAQIVVGAAAMFVKDSGAVDATDTNGGIPAFVPGTDYKDTLSNATTGAGWTNVGFTSNGLELSFEPDFGEVKVDQLLDVAKLFKQGMKVTLKTSFAEATLENLLIAIAATNAIEDHIEGTSPGTTVGKELELIAGELGAYPVERGIIAVGAAADPATLGSDATGAGIDQAQRVYVAYRALSIESVNVSAKRDEATMFEVNFRLLPDDLGAYGKIIDRTF